MSDWKIKAGIILKDQFYDVGLTLIHFKEDKATIIYSPALDLSGYGYTVSEAKKSFEISLHEFFRYTTNKKTLKSVLADLGWNISGSKKNPKFNPPKDSDLVTLNPLYNDIVNNKNYRVKREGLSLAI